MERNEVTATVKEDGVAMTVGVEVNGERYVSREGKEGSDTRYYRVSDIPDTPQFNAVKTTARIWFNLCGKVALRNAWGGDSWNVEVTYPELNVVDYQQAHIVFLAPLFNHNRNQLSTPIHEVARPTTGYIAFDCYSVDYKHDLTVRTTQIAASMKPAQHAVVPNVQKVLQYLAQPFDGGTIADLVLVNLNTVKKDDREQLRTHRTYHEHAIRRMLTEIADEQIPPTCEGIVLNDGEQLIKIVPQRFVRCNQFEHAIRNMIKRRTFSNDFHAFAPSIDIELVKTVEAMWKDPKRDNAVLVTALRQLRYEYEDAQLCGRLRGVNLAGQPVTRYRDHVHDHTMVEFTSFIEQLLNEPVNTL